MNREPWRPGAISEEEWSDRIKQDWRDEDCAEEEEEEGES